MAMSTGYPEKAYMEGGAVGAGMLSKKPPSTPIDAVHEVMQKAFDLSRQVESLRDTLLGPHPVGIGGDDRDRPSGVLPQLEERAAELSRSLDSARDAVMAIMRALP